MAGTVFRFRTLTQTFYSLFQVLLGNFDFNGLYTVDRLVTSVLFTSFVVVCWYPCHPSPSKRNAVSVHAMEILGRYTLLSTFIAVLNDAYAFTKEAMRLELEALYPNKAKESEAKQLDPLADDEDDQTDFDDRPLRQRAMEAIHSFLKFGFDPMKARREMEIAEYERELIIAIVALLAIFVLLFFDLIIAIGRYERELATYQDVLGQQQAQVGRSAARL